MATSRQLIKQVGRRTGQAHLRPKGTFNSRRQRRPGRLPTTTTVNPSVRPSVRPPARRGPQVACVRVAARRARPSSRAMPMTTTAAARLLIADELAATMIGHASGRPVAEPRATRSSYVPAGRCAARCARTSTRPLLAIHS